jgi:hypothetical protein
MSAVFRRRRILQTLLISLCGGDEQILMHVRLTKVVLKTEKDMLGLPFALRATFYVVLWLIEYGFPPLVWKFKRFTRMGMSERVAYLEESWDRSPLAPKRVMFKLVKAVCVSQLLAEHKVLRSIGYGDALDERMGLKPVRT